jgi:hypothetical protein
LDTIYVVGTTIMKNAHAILNAIGMSARSLGENFDSIIEEYNKWLEKNNLPKYSMDELWYYDALSSKQLQELEAFQLRWDHGYHLDPNSNSYYDDLSISDEQLLIVPNNASDDLAIDLVNEMYSDELALRIKKKSPKDTTTGPYAYVLKNKIKERKKKPRKPLDPVKIQAKRDKMNAFILDMNTLLQEAKRTGVSLSEYMQTQGTFSADEIRKMVAKYHANVSRFSQAEIIMRLAQEAGMVDENGKAGLEVLIQYLFPPIEGQAINEDGTAQVSLDGKPVMRKYEGATGEVSNLGTVAKEILIHRLQSIIVNKTGAEYSIEAQRTVSELIAERKDIETSQSIWKKISGLILHFEKNWESKLSSTKAGKELAFRLKRVMWRAIDYQRDWQLQLAEIGKIYESDSQRQYLYSLLDGTSSPSNATEHKFVDLIRTINHSYAQEMELLQVKIQYRNGATEFFKYDPVVADEYFPRMWEPGTFDRPNQRMIDSLINSGEAIDTAQALKLIKTFKNNQIRVQKMANMEQARETDLGGWITDPIRVYQKYVSQGSKKLAQLREFGATPELSLVQHALKHFKESKSSEALDDARDVINEVLGVRIEKELPKDPKFGLTYGIALSTGLMLQHAVFVQPGTATNMAMIGGFRNLVKGLAQVIPSLWKNKSAQEQVAWAKLSGVLAFTMNKELYDIVQDEKIRARTDKVLRSFGVTQVDSAMRLVGAMVGKMYAIEESIAYAKRQTPKGYERLKRLGLSPESIIDRSDPGILNEQELRMASLAFTEETNFVTNPLSTPVFLRNHPLGRIFMLFSRFAYQQHHLWKTVIKDNKGKALKGILAGMAVGTPMMLLKLLLMGDDPEKVLERDGIAKMIWKAFTTGSGPGIYAEALGNAIFQAVGKQTGAGTAGMAIDSPVLGLLDTMGKGIKSASKIAFTDDYTDSDINKSLKAAMMMLQTATLALPDKIGIPANAALGMTRPLVERKFYPTKKQREGSWIQ